MIGTTILDRYRIDKLLGEGGFGAVYQAEDIKFERPVALKILSKVAQQNPEHTRRFIDEAKVTSKLSHRNIPVVYDYGESEDGMLFIVTELFVGCSLEELTNDVFMTPRQASWVTSEVNEALVVAHQQGITHRDVKPPNIYIHHGSSGEEVKLLDFGIAKLNNHESHTLTGQLFGTPYFMSPEQILGRRDITPAADLYSLGAVLFYNLTSTVPFDGESQFVIFNKHVNAPVPLLMERVPTLNSPRLQQLIELLMDKNPQARPQNAYEAREIFAEVEHIAQRLDHRPLQPLLSQRSYRVTREQAPTEAVQPIHSTQAFAAIETPLELSTPIPEIFDISSVEDLSIESLDGTFSLVEETVIPITSPHLSLSSVPLISSRSVDEWRPTARLEIKDIDDALAGEDDTTDNIDSHSEILLNQQTTGITHPEEVTTPRFSNPPLAQPAIPPPPLNMEKLSGSSPSNPLFLVSGSSREVTQLFSDENLEEIPPVKEKLSSYQIWIAIAVFLVGLILSLVWLNDHSDTASSNQELSIRTVSSQENSTSNTDTQIHQGESNFADPRVNEVAPLENENDSLTLSEPRPPKQNLTRNSKKNTHSLSNKKQIEPVKRAHKRVHKSRTTSRSKTAKRAPNSKQNSKVNSASKVTVSPKNLNHFKVKLAVKPSLGGKVAYDLGTLISLSGSVYENNKQRTDLQVRYEIQNSKRYQKFTGNIIKLKKTEHVRACIVQFPKVCSSVKRLFVLDENVDSLLGN